LYFARSSLESEDDIILRRMDEGAEKWALRDLRRDEDVSKRWNMVNSVLAIQPSQAPSSPKTAYLAR
jgi:hypothetical protein